MCCHHNHGHHDRQQPGSEQTRHRGGHFPWMMLFCMLPLAALFFGNRIAVPSGFGVFGGSLVTAAPMLMLILCVGSHFFMGRHTHTGGRAWRDATDGGEERPREIDPR